MTWTNLTPRGSGFAINALPVFTSQGFKTQQSRWAVSTGNNFGSRYQASRWTAGGFAFNPLVGTITSGQVRRTSGQQYPRSP